MRRLYVVLLLSLACPGRAPAPVPSTASRYLFVWAGDADKKESDFLAVLDVDRGSSSYGSVVATVPVGAIGTRPHHTEYAMPASGVLWANGFDAGSTFRFDVRDPLHPKLLETLGDAGEYSHPHSYARMPNGHILAAFQHHSGANGVETGGLVELDSDGRLVRASSARASADSMLRPYSLVVLPALDRVVSTATDMHLDTRSRAVQVWRLSDLALLQTILLPAGPQGAENQLTAEPRLLADGQTVLVNTFSCGLYRLNGLKGDSVTAEWVYSTAWQPQQPFCAVPVVVGHFWLQPNGPEHAIVTLDVADPGKPREVSRATLGANQIPHWLALEPYGDRIVITGFRDIESRVLLARVDRASGAVRIDTTFNADFARDTWPHGATGRAIPHGAVFARP